MKCFIKKYQPGIIPHRVALQAPIIGDLLQVLIRMVACVGAPRRQDGELTTI